MVKIEKIKKGFIVKSDCYYVNINKGGTIRKMIFNDVDTGLKRDGCEYWIANNVHFQQENGSILKHSQKQNKLEITVTLKSPHRNKGGGTCTTKYLFKESSIVIESKLQPKYKMDHCDKYVCFNLNTYTHYKVSDIFEKIDQYKVVHSGVKSITLKDSNKIIIINCLSKVSGMRLYKTTSMIEVKPIWIDDTMKIEYRVEKESSTREESKKVEDKKESEKDG